MATHTLIFTPSGVQTTGETGETVYDAALRAGVDMRSICGGKGLCKRCQIEVEPGEFAKFKLSVSAGDIPKLSPTEKKARHDGELSERRRLACRAKLCGDMVVEVPSDSREGESAIQKKSTHIETELNPAVQLYMIKLETPTLADNPSDGEAICRALQEQHGVAARLTHAAMIKLQPVLLAHDNTAVAVVRRANGGRQIGRAKNQGQAALADSVIDIWAPSSDEAYGAAIDIGSTSVALYVYNLSSGEPVYEKAAMNPQIRYGEDLMSRVSYIMMNKGGEAKLTDAIRGQIKTMLSGAIDTLGIRTEQMVDVICVGNPIMHHLFIGANPTELGQAPFRLTVKDWIDLPAPALEIGLSASASVSLFPLIGGHVGADTTAAYLTQIKTMAGRSVLLVDIGTNAEIVLSHGGKVAAASSPTGPALEGAEISSGVRASLGAIERVRIDPVTKDGRVKIIGCEDWLSDTDQSADAHSITGICGSGIFEVMVELASAGLLDKSGLFITSAAPERFEQVNNVWQYTLLRRGSAKDSGGGDIIIKQTDIRSVQLAKAALFAGAQLLAEQLGCERFDEVLLAGAFGTHLDPRYVADIGIVPFAGPQVIRSIGNAAGMGAATALLNCQARDEIIAAVAEIEKVETALEPKFQDYFVGSMGFPTAPAPAGGGTRGGRRRGRSRT
jgi:uncharacterized 2Fe-2S/4Fe-4S cluster protein (DUF4445 family)